MKQQLLNQVTEDCINGNICNGIDSTLEFIEELVNLLDEDAVAKFAAMYGYDLNHKG